MQRKLKLITRIITAASAVLFLLGLSGGAAMAKAKKPIVFGDGSWESIAVSNRIAAFIISNGLGYETKFVQAETIMLYTALINAKGNNAPNVLMESWEENGRELYNDGFAKGQDPNTNEGFINLGANFPNSVQGWYVPTYMIKGDPARGIKATAPDLKSVHDLPKYWELFKDPEDPSKGRFYNGVPGWLLTAINEKKFKAYDLEKYYNVIGSGSTSALTASMQGAYKRGKAWFGYYWAPTWVLGKLDMTKLEEPPYDREIFESTAACAYPSVKCDILVHKNMPKWAPEVVEFLKKYETTLALNNAILAHMQESKLTVQETAVWFLKSHEDLWTQWVSPEVAAKVKAALK